MLVKITVIALAAGLTLFAVAGVIVQQTGLLIVDVKNRDHRVFVPVPMILVTAGLNLIPVSARFDIPEEFNHHSDLLQAAANELLNCPDGPFVEVETRNETVLIEKVENNILVEVNTPDEQVHLQIPIKATGKVFAQLARFESNR